MKHISPIQVILLAIMIAVLIYFKRKSSPKLPTAGGKEATPRAVASRERPKTSEPSEAVYLSMRQRALETTPESLGSAGNVKDDQTYGVLMEMGMPGSTLTLACFANGDASLYYQNGGGMMGGLAHEPVRNAVKDFMGLAQKTLPRMSRTTSLPVPGLGRVRFYALTPRGILTAETDRETLGQPQNEFGPLFYSGQEVVTQMRQVQGQRTR